MQADRPILVGDVPVRKTAELKDGDTIRIDTGQVLRCNFSERIIEEERNIISSLELRDVTHRFRQHRNQPRRHFLQSSAAAKWSA